MAKLLKDYHITHAFGIIGAGNAAILDAISRLGYTEFISNHHEQASVIAAATYYRTTRRMACSIVTTGAGSSNTLTGVISAWMDSMPTIIISGNENTRSLIPGDPRRSWGVQGYDSTKVAAPVTKKVYRIFNINEIMYDFSEAYHLAKADRPGPVWIDIPQDIASTVL